MADHGVTERQEIARAFAEGDRVVWGGEEGTVVSLAMGIRFDTGDVAALPAAGVRHAPVEGGVEGVECEWVLTWHPLVAPDDGMVLTEGEPVEIPLGEPWVLPGDSTACGEFRLSDREVGAPAADVEPGGLVRSLMPQDWRRQVAEVAEFGRVDSLVGLLESWQVSGA